MRFRAYHFAAFVSAFLLFQVQPMVAKAILPVFGGSYLVWGACMVFFQAVLLSGYAYAHIVCRPRGTAERDEGAARSRVVPLDALRWFLLSAAACAALLATTNTITFDVASVPLLWVVPLAAYLLAFSSGSIPAHLLTVEAFEEYLRVLRPGGLLLLHVSNKVLDLEPVVYANARSLGLGACEASNETDTHPDAETTYWMAVSAGEDTLSRLRAELAWADGSSASPAVRPWRDRYSDIPGAMIRRWRPGGRSRQGKKCSTLPGVTVSPASIFRTSSA